VEHVFTHFSLTLDVYVAESRDDAGGMEWRTLAEARAALPTVFKKALDRALG
jgi:A/G-specific adenine glycosylase